MRSRSNCNTCHCVHSPSGSRFAKPVEGCERMRVILSELRPDSLCTQSSQFLTQLPKLLLLKVTSPDPGKCMSDGSNESTPLKLGAADRERGHPVRGQTEGCIHFYLSSGAEFMYAIQYMSVKVSPIIVSILSANQPVPTLCPRIRLCASAAHFWPRTHIRDPHPLPPSNCFCDLPCVDITTTFASCQLRW